MKPNYTHIAILLDRSGSMNRLANDMEGALSAFLDEQKLIPGELTISLSKFDSEYTVEFKRVPVNEVGEIKLQPRGSTALIDSAYRMIKEVKEDLDSLPEEEKPEKVLFVIITDGEENASRENTREELKNLITEQETVSNWAFVFLGANQDAFANASSYGIRASNSQNYTADTQGVYKMSSSLSMATKMYRTTTDSFTFTESDSDTDGKE